MKQLVYAISGYKNSGKTTTVVQVVSLLSEKGFKVAVIKHDGHDFDADVPGTDSYRAKEAGAYATAVFSENRMLIHKESKGIDEKMLISFFPEADIIILEGFKNSDYPKYWCRYPEVESDPLEIVDQIIDLYERAEDEIN